MWSIFSLQYLEDFPRKCMCFPAESFEKEGKSMPVKENGFAV